MSHTISITFTGGHGYPFRANCSCGWKSNTYAADHAAQAMADDHIATVALMESIIR